LTCPLIVRTIFAMIAVEGLFLLLGSLILVVLVVQLFARQSGSAPEHTTPVTPAVKLVRMVEFSDSHEETHLVVNETPILTVSDEGLRQDAYASEVERLEALATKIASALGVNVEFARISAEPYRERKGRHSYGTAHRK
jgi:hypothetical protein